MAHQKNQAKMESHPFFRFFQLVSLVSPFFVFPQNPHFLDFAPPIKKMIEVARMIFSCDCFLLANRFLSSGISSPQLTSARNYSSAETQENVVFRAYERALVP